MKRRRWKKEDVQDEEILKNIDAIKQYLEDVISDRKHLLLLLQQLEDLEKERQVASKSLQETNLHTQAKIIEDFIKRYRFFQEDADVNGLRVKQIIHKFFEHAQKAGLKELVKEKKKQSHWDERW